MRFKHRSKKLKVEHRIIHRLREYLEDLQTQEDIDAIIPGRIEKCNSSTFQFKVQYPTGSGLKCIAKSGGEVQEVFITTKNPDKVKSFIEEKRGR